MSTATLDDVGAPKVIEPLTDGEAYLYAILKDPSGLDQAEFLWFDPSSEDNKFCHVCGSSITSSHFREHDLEDNDDDQWYEKYMSPSGCFRAWPYQWSWWRHDDILQIDQCARSVGKSLSIKVRGCAFPFVKPGQEMVITAPELVHLEPITGLIESQVYATRLLREMIPRTRSAITHRPFQLNFSNGARIIGRIPQRDGKGVKGIHPIWLELDEAQDYPEPGWTELTETLQRGLEGAQWRAHGVTRGVRDKFYEYTQEHADNMWRVHRYPAMYRPNWSERERVQKEAEYGGRNDPDYRRNVLGLHGDNTNPIFVLAQLMSCVDENTDSDYNALEYFHPGWGRTKRTPALVSVENLRLYDMDITEVLDYPRQHLQYRGVDKRNPSAYFWVGMDVGFTTDPTELLVWVETWPHGPNKPSKIKLIARSSLVRMPHHEQIKAMLHTIHFYRPRAFGIDKGGHGLPLFQEIQEYLDAFRTKDQEKIPPWMHDYDLEFAVQVIKGYNFAEKLIVDFDKSIDVGDFDDPVAKAGMRRNAKEYATDVLRDLVDANRIELPWDPHLLTQYSGATQKAAKGSTDQYGRRLFSKGNDHTLDASRFMALAWSQYSIEALLNQPKEQEAVLDRAVW